MHKKHNSNNIHNNNNNNNYKICYVQPNCNDTIEPVLYNNNNYDKSYHHSYTNSSIFVNTKFQNEQERMTIFEKSEGYLCFLIIFNIKTVLQCYGY